MNPRYLEGLRKKKKGHKAEPIIADVHIDRIYLDRK